MVSIVLPVYNGEKFLAIAIESILNQTYPDWELLVVDDGSKDSTATICDAFATRDSRIKVYHQQNGGVNAARAKGIDNASGEFLTFLDADDTFSPDALEKMLDGFSERADVVYCGSANRYYDQKEYIITLWKGRIRPGICTKMFRTGLYKKIDYWLDRRLAMGEDLLLNSMYALDIKGAQVIPYDCYKVNKNNAASVTRTFKHNWEYEKYFFSRVDELFLSKCTSLPFYKDIELQVNKCWLNAMKYVMLDGNVINYSDAEFKAVQAYFNDHKEELGPSEWLIFKVRNAPLYRLLIKSYTKALKFKEFFRFVIVGLVATAIHYGVYRLLDLVIPANPAYAAGYVISFLFNFFLTARFTFKKKATVKKGIGFGLSHLVNFTLHMLLLNLFLFIGLSDALAPIPVYCICIPVNFLLVRFVFNKL